jgi:hypothetical protein
MRVALIKANRPLSSSALVSRSALVSAAFGFKEFAMVEEVFLK